MSVFTIHQSSNGPHVGSRMSPADAVSQAETAPSVLTVPSTPFLLRSLA